MNATIYCRVSTDNQEREGTSLQTQLKNCLTYSYEAKAEAKVEVEYQAISWRELQTGKGEVGSTRRLQEG